MTASLLRRRAQRGATIVEMALIAPIFLLLLVGVLELGIMYCANLTMQYAVREGARYAVTGQSNLDPNTSNQQRYLAVIQRMKDSSSGFYAKVSPVITVNGTTYASAAAYNASMFGSAGDIVVIQVKCTWPLSTPIMRAFFSNGKYTFTVGATMRNEIYSS